MKWGSELIILKLITFHKSSEGACPKIFGKHIFVKMADMVAFLTNVLSKMKKTVTLHHKPLVKSTPDQFFFCFANLETFMFWALKDISFYFRTHCEVKLWLFELPKCVYFNGPYYHILVCISKSFLPTLREACNTGSQITNIAKIYCWQANSKTIVYITHCYTKCGNLVF